MNVRHHSILYRILQRQPEEIAALDGLDEEGLRWRLGQIESAMARLPDARMQRADADLIRREFEWAAGMLRHACWRGIWVLGRAHGSGDTALRNRLANEADELLAEHESIWMTRNRPGGFSHSREQVLKMRRSYQ